MGTGAAGKSVDSSVTHGDGAKAAPASNRGWVVTFAGTGINLALGVLYAWSIFKGAIQKDFGWDAARLNDPYAVCCLVFAFSMILAGRCQDKLGPRITAFIGGLLVGVGFFTASRTTGYWAWVLGFGVLAGLGIGFGYSSATPPALKWFPPRKTGLIAGLVVAGFGLASVYIAPRSVKVQEMDYLLPTPSSTAFVAGFEDSFGKRLDDFYSLTEDEKILRKANGAYSDAAKGFKEVELTSRVAESYWKIARNLDLLGDTVEAAGNYDEAFNEYENASKSMPSFSGFFLNYASYMKAWSEIEKAKFAHGNRRYASAIRHYRKTANLLKQNKKWGYLSSNFLAWSFLEKAEALSRNHVIMHDVSDLLTIVETRNFSNHTI